MLYDDPTPTGPLGSVATLGVAGEKALERLRELFQIRPIWSKRALLNRFAWSMGAIAEGGLGGMGELHA